MDDDASAAAVHRGNQSFEAPTGFGYRSANVDVDAAVCEKRGAEDHCVAPMASMASARARPCGCRRRRGRAARADAATSALVGADALGRVEVDELHLGIAREALDPAVDVGRLDGEPLALNELDDSAALEVDRWNQHVSMQQPHWDAAAIEKCLQVADRVLGIVKDDAASAASARARVKTSRNDRTCRAPPDAITGIVTARETAAVSSQSNPARVPSRSIEVSRISPAPRDSASRAHSTASVGSRACRCANRPRTVLARFASIATTTAWLP